MTPSRSDDEAFMLRALALAMRGRLSAPPNPWVGCLIVKEGSVIGEGYHHRVGEPHAEIHALKQAKAYAADSTVYVTLEPCSHFGRTPPCVQALIDAKVARIVVGLQDPDSRVSGAGLAKLRAAGIAVAEGVATEAITQALMPYLYHRRTGLPYCIGKAAISVDGRLAAADGTSQWISGPEARHDVHRLRAESQAILVGADTALLDNPSLTVREAVPPPLPPLRVVLDSRGRLLPPKHIFESKVAPTLMVTTESCPPETQKRWRDSGAEIFVAPATAEQRIELKPLLQFLGARGILQLLVEGGRRVLGSFLQEHCLQRLCLYVGPCILGHLGKPLFHDDTITTLSEAPKLKLVGTKVFGQTMRIDYDLNAESQRRRDAEGKEER